MESKEILLALEDDFALIYKKNGALHSISATPEAWAAAERIQGHIAALRTRAADLPSVPDGEVRSPIAPKLAIAHCGGDIERLANYYDLYVRGLMDDLLRLHREKMELLYPNPATPLHPIAPPPPIASDRDAVLEEAATAILARSNPYPHCQVSAHAFDMTTATDAGIVRALKSK